MSYEDLDVLYRSRLTLIKILKENGYETKDYERFSPWEIEAMAIGQTSFQIDVTKANPDGPITKCRVVYSLQKLKQKIYGFLSGLTNTEDPTAVDPLTTEVIVILLEDVADVFHKAALDEWLKNKLRIRFFKAHTLVYDPRDHTLVPPHEKLPSEEHAEFMKQNYVRSKGNLPMIRFHEDIIARVLGLLPGDIVKITRPSPSAGLYDIYRVCVP